MSESTEDLQVMDFFAVILQDEDLRDKFMIAMESNDDVAIITMADQLGYKFSPQSLREEIKNILNLIAPIAILENDE